MSSADLNGAAATDRRRAARAHERQHLPLRRLFQHRRGDHRSRREAGMKPFTYERAAIARRGRRRRRAHAGRQVHRRRHQPARPDEARDRDADASDRRQRPRARQDRADAGRRPAHRRAGAQHRSRRRCARAARLWRALARAARRRLGPAAQQGDDRGQSAAAHALPLFLRHQPALQQAPARQRLRARSAASAGSTPSSA